MVQISLHSSFWALVFEIIGIYVLLCAIFSVFRYFIRGFMIEIHMFLRHMSKMWSNVLKSVEYRWLYKIYFFHKFGSSMKSVVMEELLLSDIFAHNHSAARAYYYVFYPPPHPDQWWRSWAFSSQNGSSYSESSNYYH